MERMKKVIVSGKFRGHRWYIKTIENGIDITLVKSTILISDIENVIDYCDRELQSYNGWAGDKDKLDFWNEVRKIANNNRSEYVW